MTKASKLLFSIVLGMLIAVSSQSAFAISEAAKAAAAAAAKTAKDNGMAGLPAANTIAEAGYDAAEKDQDLASALACLVFEESQRAGVEDVTRENAAKAAAKVTGAAPGAVILVCDEAYAYTVTSSSGMGAGVGLAALVLGAIGAGGGGGGGGGGDNVPTSP